MSDSERGVDIWLDSAGRYHQRAVEQQRAQETQGRMTAEGWATEQMQQAAQQSAARRLEDVQTMLEQGFINEAEMITLLDTDVAAQAKHEAGRAAERLQALELQNQRFEEVIGKQRAEIQALKSELAEERMAKRGRR